MPGAEITFRVEAEAGDLTVGKHHFSVGEHTVVADKNLSRALGSVEATGGVTILKGAPTRSHIESDKDSLKVLDKHMSKLNDQGEIIGGWQIGNHMDFIAQREDAIRNTEELLGQESVEGVVPEHLIEAALADKEKPTAKDRDSASREVIREGAKRLVQQVVEAKVRLKKLEDLEG